MTITISSDEPSTIDRVLQLLNREKVAFDVKKTKKDVLDDLKDAVAEVRRKDLTGEQGQTFEEFLEEVDLLSIYDKSEQSDISDKEIANILKDL